MPTEQQFRVTQFIRETLYKPINIKRVYMLDALFYKLSPIAAFIQHTNKFTPKYFEEETIHVTQFICEVLAPSKELLRE